MTVQELIVKLEQMPKDAKVLYRCCSEWDVMDSDEVTLVRAEDKSIFLHDSPHGGDQYMDYRESYFRPGGFVEGQEPNFVTVVCFPGN